MRPRIINDGTCSDMELKVPFFAPFKEIEEKVREKFGKDWVVIDAEPKKNEITIVKRKICYECGRRVLCLRSISTEDGERPLCEDCYMDLMGENKQRRK